MSPNINVPNAGLSENQITALKDYCDAATTDDLKYQAEDNVRHALRDVLAEHAAPARNAQPGGRRRSTRRRSTRRRSTRRSRA